MTDENKHDLVVDLLMCETAEQRAKTFVKHDDLARALEATELAGSGSVDPLRSQAAFRREIIQDIRTKLDADNDPQSFRKLLTAIIDRHEATGASRS